MAGTLDIQGIRKSFTMEYWIDEDWYVGRLKEVPSIFSQGESLPELEKNIRDAYRLMMDSRSGTASAS
ncbi:MAG TPA: type II toxin-antitoxin system HicB family antitoxin [Thermoanaerobaculia bacterium]|nr:type II toxin-antitoxin system HicB family antitoxin [Thermoanaerobaculia bacterium]